MMKLIETDNEQQVDLDDNTCIYLLYRNVSIADCDLGFEEYARNVYRKMESGDVLWRIKTEQDYKGGPFTQLFINENPRLMYNSSGFRYLVDLETGVAEIHDYPLLGPWKKRPLPPGYPTTRFIKRHNDHRVYLDDGTYLFLAERNTGISGTGLTPEDYACNVFRMTESGEILWRIKTDRDSFGSPFIELFLDEDPRKMANWDGLKYLVNLETGEAEAYDYSR